MVAERRAKLTKNRDLVKQDCDSLSHRMSKSGDNARGYGECPDDHRSRLSRCQVLKEPGGSWRS